MNSGRSGYSMIEVMISIALITLSVSFYLTFASQTNVETTQSKNYLQATNLMENLYQEILVSSTARWQIGGMYSTHFDINSKSTDILEEYYYTATFSVREYPLLPNLKEIEVFLEWTEDGKDKRMDFRVIK